MDILHITALWLHFVGLAAGSAASVGGPVVGAAMDRTGPEHRVALADLAARLGKVGRLGVGLLVVTGVVLIWGSDGGLQYVNQWFWIKIALVTLLIAGIIVGTRNSRKAMAGDSAARMLAPKLGMLNLVLLLSILLSAVLSFG